MKLLLIENTQGSFSATPILNGKSQKQMSCEFWSEEDLNLFVDEFRQNPYAAIFAFESLKQQKLYKETKYAT